MCPEHGIISGVSPNKLLQLLLTIPLVAAADFDEDEVVFSIPRNAVLNVQTALPTANARASQAILNMPSWLVCCLRSASQQLGY